MIVAGYYYTAQQLTRRIFFTLCFVIAIEIVRALARRLILVRRRAISIEQAKQKREEAVQQGIGDASQLGPSQIVPPDEFTPDVAFILSRVVGYSARGL